MSSRRYDVRYAPCSRTNRQLELQDESRASVCTFQTSPPSKPGHTDQRPEVARWEKIKSVTTFTRAHPSQIASRDHVRWLKALHTLDDANTHSSAAGFSASITSRMALPTRPEPPVTRTTFLSPIFLRRFPLARRDEVTSETRFWQQTHAELCSGRVTFNFSIWVNSWIVRTRSQERAAESSRSSSSVRRAASAYEETQWETVKAKKRPRSTRKMRLR